MIANVGSRWEGGKLVFFSKATGNIFATFDPDNESLDVSGLSINGVTITQAENQTASSAADVPGLVADFNALLTKLKAAGLMEPDS